ncbi:hypothetical protein [Gordonia sp. (in: high G+C Gram-positive bacteria)]|uniref:glycine-rich domain-containing protein n=1 Tax=Gordonia sp. (in: high G+C Gram-positive bacteria) TaxID=84139 RepID=UPI003C74D81E
MDPRPGWTGTRGPTAPDPRPGWGPLLVRMLLAAGHSHDNAALLARMIVADAHHSADAAHLAGAAFVDRHDTVDVVGLLAHLTGGDAGRGADQVLALLRQSGDFTDPHRMVDVVGMLAHLTAPDQVGVGLDQAGARFAAHAPETEMFDAIGTYTYQVPAWCTHLDIVAIGGGASGQTGNGANNSRGSGGAAGSWHAKTVTRAESWGPSYVLWSTATMTVTVGAGGPTAPNSDHAGPNPGEASTVGSWLTAPGGTGTISGQNGGNPGNFTFNGVTYTGGLGGTGNGGNSTTPPGGGGAGGNGGIFGSRTRGGYGGRGRVWITARQGA